MAYVSRCQDDGSPIAPSQIGLGREDDVGVKCFVVGGWKAPISGQSPKLGRIPHYV
jgi:hypothetical protein